MKKRPLKKTGRFKGKEKNESFIKKRGDSDMRIAIKKGNRNNARVRTGFSFQGGRRAARAKKIRTHKNQGHLLLQRGRPTSVGGHTRLRSRGLRRLKPEKRHQKGIGKKSPVRKGQHAVDGSNASGRTNGPQNELRLSATVGGQQRPGAWTRWPGILGKRPPVLPGGV